MPKFLNKNELVILALIILLFDVSGFCMVSFPYIVSAKGSMMAIFITMIYVIYSTYIYHVICNSPPPYSVEYATNGEHNSVTSCDIKVDEYSKNKDSKIDEMKKICKEKTITHGTYISERVVLSIISLIFMVFLYVGIFKVTNVGGNTKGVRAMRAMPIILVTIGMLLFSNIYMPFLSNIQY